MSIIIIAIQIVVLTDIAQVLIIVGAVLLMENAQSLDVVIEENVFSPMIVAKIIMIVIRIVASIFVAFLQVNALPADIYPIAQKAAVVRLESV